MLVRLVTLAILVGLAGCGEEKPKLVTVTGKVVFKGKPLTAGSLYFHPDAGNGYTKDVPSSLLQLDGAFAMKTFPFGEGVTPGKYKITLAPELANRLGKPAYAAPDKTPWTVDVPDAGLTDTLLEVK